jgi:hypothetical protein
MHNLQGQHFVPPSCKPGHHQNVSFTTLAETNMATWYELPREVQHSILSIYCRDLVTDFSDSLELDPWGYQPHHLAKELKTLAWPEPPTPLVFFASALKTCRNFYNILSEEISIEDDSSPGRVLQRLQYDGMNELARNLHSRSGRHVSLLDESCYVHFIYRTVGCFWKNPMVFDTENRFCDFLMTIPQLSRLILIPHLQPWLLYETGQEEEEDSIISDSGDDGEDRDEEPFENPLDAVKYDAPSNIGSRSKHTGRVLTLGVGGNLDHCHHMRLEEGRFFTDDDGLDVVSIAGVPNKTAKSISDERELDEHELDEHELVQQSFDRSCDPELPVLCDIRDSEPDTWWLFPPEDYYYTTVDDEHCGLAEYQNHWFLVNYKLRKLYMGPNGTEAYHWDRVWDIPARQPRAKARTSPSRRTLVDKEVQTESHSTYGESQSCAMVLSPPNDSDPVGFAIEIGQSGS